MDKVNATILEDSLVITIPVDFLNNAFYMGVTTNVFGKVTDEREMLKYFAHKFQDSNNDSQFGRFIDAVCAEAIEGGESFVEDDEE